MRCVGPPHVLWSLVFLILAVSGWVGGSAVNRTIDDVFGDSVTGDMVQYLPEVPASDGPLWINQTSCANCANVPDAAFTLDNTWSAARYLADVGSLSLSLKFTGTAIYVFFVVPNFAAGSGLASTVRCDIFIDGVAAGSFTHESNGSGVFEYNSLIYKNTTVPNGDHVLLIETTGADPAIIIFDYAIYTQIIPDPPSSSILTTSSSSQTIDPSPTVSAPSHDAGSFTSEFQPSSSTQSDSVPAFPTAPDTATPTSASSALPFIVTGSPSDVNSPFATTLPSLSPAVTQGSQRSVPVVVIVAAVAGAVILIVLILVFIVMCRRRRRHRALASGTISVFDLLNDTPPPSQSTLPRSHSPPRPHSPQTPRPRPLPIPPPMSEQQGGRSIGATQIKMQMQTEMNAQTQSPVAGPSGSGSHSAQSSVSYYSDSRSDLHIHIPMTSFRPAYSPGSNTPSHSHSHSHSHTHSPITRNGVPMPPEQEEIVREILLGSLAVDRGSVRRGSEGSVYTPTDAGQDDDELPLWGPPMVHVDSGIRISRAMMELPPQYAPA